MNFSVIMPAFNEEKNIRRTMEALVAQTLPHDRFEVIVVDNGSSDDTVSIANSYAPFLAIRVISSTGGSVASVRNAGALIASGEVFVFLDADCTTSRDWLARGSRHNQPNAIWGAHYIVPQDATWVGRIWGDFQATEQTGPTRFLPSCNIFIRREDFKRIGGFRESQETSEDVEFCSRAREYGMQIIAIPELAVIHEATPKKLGQFYRQNYWHGKHVLRLFFAQLPSLKSLPVVGLSFYVLLMLIATLVVPCVAVALHHPLWSIVAPVLLIVPASLLALRKTVPAGRWKDAPALWTLYMTYLIARAASIVSRPSRSHR